MSYTLTETGNVLTETREGITMPADYSFETVNDYVHGLGVNYEDLESLCLGMASHIDKLRRGDSEIAKAVAAEREACAVLCERSDRYRGDYFAAKIRGRSTEEFYV